jgi:hypothetical protein
MLRKLSLELSLASHCTAMLCKEAIETTRKPWNLYRSCTAPMDGNFIGFRVVFPRLEPQPLRLEAH